MMVPPIRIVSVSLGGLCLALLVVVGFELAGPALDAEGPAAATAESGDAPADMLASQDEIDAAIAAIAARPLFTPGRRPPEAKKPAAAQDEAPVPKPPELRGRLAGVMLGPEEREALFARQGEKPIAVHVGGEIDGWTVAAIDSDHVELTSAFGKLVMQPTQGERGEGAAPAVRGAVKRAARPPAKKAAAPAKAAPAKAPLKTSTPNHPVPKAQTASRAQRNGAQQ